MSSSDLMKSDMALDNIKFCTRILFADQQFALNLSAFQMADLSNNVSDSQVTYV
jgi:hypothetical protein